MIALIDTSVVLRKLFGERGSLAEWRDVREAYASRILPVELGRAAGPMPTVLGSLDAIHLATAQELAATRAGLVLATHDKQLARAARASGLDVRGV